jgi:hypothetical protein
MREDVLFTPEEMAAFRAIDKQRALEQEAETVERVVVPASVAAPIMTPEQSRGWNKWASELIDRQVVLAIGVLMKELGILREELRDEIRETASDRQHRAITPEVLCRLVAEQIDAPLKKYISDEIHSALRTKSAEIIDLPKWLPRRAHDAA